MAQAKTLTPAEIEQLLRISSLTCAVSAGSIHVCSAGNPVTVTTTQGETYEEAVQNLKEATRLYLDEFPIKTHSHPATSYNLDPITRNVTRLSQNTISH